MYEGFYRLIGKTVAFIGMILVLFPLFVGSLLYADANSLYNPPSMFISQQGILVMIVLLSFGLILTSTGMYIYKSFQILIPFLTKDGEPIHSGKPWKKGLEQGLFLTSCGLVVSINQESKSTTNVGYKIVAANRATHRDCIIKEGGEVLDRFAKRRSW